MKTPQKTARRWLGVFILASVLILLAGQSSAKAQALTKLTGHFGGADQDYNNMPIVAGLTDASGYFGKDPISLPPKDQQILAQTTGVAQIGVYSLTLPDKPSGKPLNGNTNLMVFDVRLMSDAASRGYLAENEDIIASSLKLDSDLNVTGGIIIVWAADDQQKLDLGTLTGSPIAVPAGWSLVNLDTKQIAQDSTVDLTTAVNVTQIDYQNLSCADLIPAFLDHAQKYYPFTSLHHVDWASLRSQLIPEAKAATTSADCEKVIRDFGNAVPDGHVDFNLPALQDEWAGSAGIVLDQTDDGQTVASVIRSGGPADQAGIKIGAVITSWDGQSIQDALKNEVLQYANASTPHALLGIKLGLLGRGPMDSTVAVAFQNPGEAAQTATLTRNKPQRVNSGKNPPAVTDNKLPSGIGYIRIDTFIDGRFVPSFDKTVDGLIAANVPGIIIDIRDNPGGMSQIENALAGRFFTNDYLVGQQINADGRIVALEEISPRAPVYQGCVEILVNANTASAGDLFAYTFKAGKRAIIVGHTPTSGAAGTVSGGMFLLPDQAQIQIPAGALYDANGNIIDEGSGVTPDITVPQTIQSIISPDDDVLNAAVAAIPQCSAQK